MKTWSGIAKAEGSDLNADPYEEAAKLGLVAITPEPDQLFLDLDSVADQEFMEKVQAVFFKNGFLASVERITTSKSGNKHVQMRVATANGEPRILTELERVAL